MGLHVHLITLGGLFFFALIADAIGRRTEVPRVTLLVLFGIVAGPTGFNVLPAEFRYWYEFLATAGLTMVAFLLGGSLSRKLLMQHGREILIVSGTVAVISAVLVGSGLLVLGYSAIIAILLAGISTATDPAVTLETIRDTGTRGEFSDTLKGIVAIDDLWGIILFSILLVFASGLNGESGLSIIGLGAWEIVGAAIVGALVGLPASILTGRISPGEPSQVEALSVVFLCAGIALWLEVSFLLTGVFAGAIIANMAKHHTRAFNEIEHIERPFMVLFFFLAGASLDFGLWRTFLPLILAYVLFRAVSRIIGGWSGGLIAHSNRECRIWMGQALLPQAGVAIGMALIAGNHFPELRDPILAVALASTVIFEVLGPFATRNALTHAASSELGRSSHNA